MKIWGYHICCDNSPACLHQWVLQETIELQAAPVGFKLLTFRQNSDALRHSGELCTDNVTRQMLLLLPEGLEIVHC